MAMLIQPLNHYSLSEQILELKNFAGYELRISQSRAESANYKTTARALITSLSFV